MDTSLRLSPLGPMDTRLTEALAHDVRTTSVTEAQAILLDAKNDREGVLADTNSLQALLQSNHPVVIAQPDKAQLEMLLNVTGTIPAGTVAAVAYKWDPQTGYTMSAEGDLEVFQESDAPIQHVARAVRASITALCENSGGGGQVEHVVPPDGATYGQTRKVFKWPSGGKMGTDWVDKYVYLLDGDGAPYQYAVVVHTTSRFSFSGDTPKRRIQFRDTAIDRLGGKPPLLTEWSPEQDDEAAALTWDMSLLRLFPGISGYHREGFLFQITYPRAVPSGFSFENDNANNWVGFHFYDDKGTDDLTCHTISAWTVPFEQPKVLVTRRVRYHDKHEVWTGWYDTGDYMDLATIAPLTDAKRKWLFGAETSR